MAAVNAVRLPRDLTVEVGALTLPAWLAVVREANGQPRNDPSGRLHPNGGLFDTLLESGPWWAGGTAEEYPEARIVFDETGVRIIGKTDAATAEIARAADVVLDTRETT